MRVQRISAVAAILLSACIPARSAEAVRIFRDLSFDAALKEAAARKKIVLVDFYTEGCVPCKRMDLTTWADPVVASFLDEKAISLRIDANKEEKLAKRYRVSSYPTMLLVRPDGTAIDWIAGFLPPDKFLAELKEALAGRTALNRARAAVEASEAKGDADRSARARMDLAGVEAQQNDRAAALKDYLWLFDEGMKKSAANAELRSSYVLFMVKNLSEDYPPALAALRERRDAAKERLKGPDFSEEDASDFAALNHVLFEPKATLDFFDSLPAGDSRRRALRDQVFDQLLAARRYAEAADARPVEKARNDFALGAKEAWSGKSGEDAEASRMNREFAVEEASKEIEALAGAGKSDGARDLIRRVRAVEDSPWVRAILLKHLKRAGFDPGLTDY